MATACTPFLYSGNFATLLLCASIPAGDRRYTAASNTATTGMHPVCPLVPTTTALPANRDVRPKAGWRCSAKLRLLHRGQFCTFAAEVGIQSEKRGRAVPSFFVLHPAFYGLRPQ